MYMISNISPGIFADDFPKEEEEEQIEETSKVVPPLKPEKNDSCHTEYVNT